MKLLYPVFHLVLCCLPHLLLVAQCLVFLHVHFNFQPCSVTNSAYYCVNSIPACSCSNVRACSSSISAYFSNCIPACCTINVLSTNPIRSVVEGVVPNSSSISDSCSNVNNTMNSENSTVDSSAPLTVERTIFENKIQKLINEKDKALLELSDVMNEC